MKKFMVTVSWTLVSACLLSCSVAEPPGDLEWSNGWVRALPPGSGMTAAYGELHNNSTDTIELDAFDSDSFAVVELHKSIMQDGVSRMREQRGVRIAAGETLLLQPGGLHLMLMKPGAEISTGDRVEIGVTGSGKRYVFSLPVDAR